MQAAFNKWKNSPVGAARAALKEIIDGPPIEPQTEAEKFLREKKIAYKRERGRIVVTEPIYLNDKNLDRLPDLTGVICDCSFHCENNKLTSLKGAPMMVRGGFFCQNNRLADLVGAPSYIPAAFDCRNNQLTTLQGGPEIVGALFWCEGNKLVSLEHGPKQVGGTYCCKGNPLHSLKHAPTEFGKLSTDWGTFESPDEVPLVLRTSPQDAAITREKVGGQLALQQPVRRLKRFIFR